VRRVPSAPWDACKKDDDDAEAGRPAGLLRNGGSGPGEGFAPGYPHLHHLHHQNYHHHYQQQHYQNWQQHQAYVPAPSGPNWAPPFEPSEALSPVHARSWAMAVAVGDPAANGGGGGLVPRTLSGDSGSHLPLGRTSSGSARAQAALLSLGPSARAACVAICGAVLTSVAHGAALAGALLAVAAAEEGGSHFMVPMALHGERALPSWVLWAGRED
jgi:hypothetical protein